MEIGSLVQVTGKDLVGTLTYKGQVHFADGEFAGIVLNEPKGKNNGTVQGQKYFECEDGFGVMVPVNKIQPVTDGMRLALSSRTTSEVSLANSDRSSAESRVSSTAARKAAGGAVSRPVTASSTASKKSAVIPPTSVRRTIAPPSAVGSKMLAPPANPTARVSTKSLSAGVPRRPSVARSDASSSGHAPADISDTSNAASIDAEHSVNHAVFLTPSAQNNASTEVDETVTRLEREKADLASKLDTLLTKRAEDKIKLRDSEKLKLQYEQLEIHNKRLLENNKNLQQQLNDASRSLAEQAADLAEKSSSGTDESSRALLESLALDKEIAEEAADQLKEENSQLNARVKELEERVTAAPANASLRPSSPATVDGTEDTKTRMRQLEDENQKFRDACTHLRDALSEEEATRLKLEEDFVVARQELGLINPLYAQVNQELVQVRQGNEELREQLDSAASAQEMAEKLIKDNLDLKSTLDDLNNQIDELTTLRDLDDELLEHARSKEKEYLAELSKRDAYISNLKLNYYNIERGQAGLAEQTERFGERFRQMEAENVQLRQQIDMIVPDHQSAMQSSRRNVRVTSEQIIGQQRLHSKLLAANVSVQRQRVEHLTDTLRYTYTLNFMPDSFAKARESTYIDAVCSLVALMEKCTLLEQQVTTNFHTLQNQPAAKLMLDGSTTTSTDDSGIAVDSDEKLSNGNSAVYHERDRACFAAYLLFVCECIRYVARKISRRARLATDMTPLVGFVAKLQKAGDDIDYYLKLLQENHLDENVALDSLEQSFFTLLTEQRNLNFDDQPQPSSSKPPKVALTEGASDKASDADFLQSVLSLVNRAVLSVNLSLDWLKKLHGDAEVKDIDKKFFDILRRLEAGTSETVNYASACKRPLDTDATVYLLKIPADLTKSLDTRPTILLDAVRLMHRWARASSRASHSAANVDFSSSDSQRKISRMDAAKLFDKLREVNVSLGAAAFARAPEEEVCVVVQELAVSMREVSQGLQNGKWFHGSFETAETASDESSAIDALLSPSKRPPQPQSNKSADQMRVGQQQYSILPALLLRAQAFKKQLVDAEALKYDIENKQQEIFELQKHVRGRSDEIEALKLRISTFERKFETSSTSREGQLITLKRENDELEIKLRRREAEVESQHTIFMQTIKKLEQEKQTLEQHLKQAGKRFLAGGAGSSSRMSGFANDSSFLSEANGTSGGAGDVAAEEYTQFGTAIGPVSWTSYLTPAEEAAAMHSIINQQSAEMTALRLKLADKLLMQLVPEVKKNSVTAVDSAAVAEKRWQAKADFMQKQINTARREYYDLAKAIDFSASPQEMQRQLRERDQRQVFIVQKLQRLKIDMQKLEVERKRINTGNFYIQ